MLVIHVNSPAQQVAVPKVIMWQNHLSVRILYKDIISWGEKKE